MRSIGLGVPAYNRAWGLLLGDKLPLETMLSGNYSKLTPEKRESLYGRGWLLVRSLPKGFGPPTMRAALHYASDLAPQDEGLRMNSALQYLRDGKTAEAKHALTMIAYDPHGEQLAQFARTIIEKIDAGDAKDALAAAVLQATSTPTAR